MSENISLGVFYGPASRANIYLMLYCIVAADASLSDTMEEIIKDPDINNDLQGRQLGGFARSFSSATGSLGERLIKILSPDIDERILLRMLNDEKDVSAVATILSTLGKICENK